MKRLSVILLLIPVFAALLWGCGGSHDARVVAVLDRADSLLLTSDPALHDSVRQELEVLDTARALRTDEMLRARHALLLVQARYKCYATIPADSALIDTAYRYYADHHSGSANHERYTRSLIYQGAVAEELGHPQQALQWYLEAEQTADPNDHFNLGFTNLRIAELYEGEYVTDSTSLKRLKQALSHFQVTGDTYYQAVCLTDIGGLYRTHNNDSAMNYLQHAIGFSKEHGLTYNYYEALDNLCGLYYYMEDYTKSKDFAIKLYQESQSDYDGTRFLFFGIRSFAKLGMIDSAEYYLKQLSPPQTQVDTMLYHKTLSVIAESKNDYKSGIANYRKSNEVADTIMLQSNAALLKNTEHQYHTNQLKTETKIVKGKVWLLWMIIALVVLIACYIAYKFIKARNLMHQLDEENKEITKALAELQEKANRMEQRINEGEIINSSVASVIECEMAVLTELSQKLSYPRRMSLKAVLFSKGISTKLSLKPLSLDFWKDLLQLADIKTNGLISHLNDNYECKTKDLRFIALVSLGFSNQMIQQCLDYTSIKTVSIYKSNIIKNITGEPMTLNLYIENHMKNNKN